jgi:outer membrane lipoprotein-sorting protein
MNAQSAVEIVQKSIDLLNGESSKATVLMTITRPKYARSLEMRSWSAGNDYFMVYISSPAQEKGQVFMKRQTDMWNWIPKISRMIKIPPSMMSQSWMGSDFTNDDLVKVNSLAVDYTHTIIGEEVLNGYDCYIIELIPTPESPVVWGKVNMWIAKKEYFQLKMEYFDEDMELVNLMVASEVKQFGDRLLPSKMVMTPMKKKGQETMMVTIDQSFNVNIDKEFFSQQSMKRVR